MAYNATVLILCDGCESILEDDDMEPLGDDLLLCYSCYLEEYFEEYFEECRLCGDSIYRDDLDERYIAVMMEAPGCPCDVPAGIYEALRMPYYTEGLIGSSWLHSNALRLVTLLEPFDDGDPPCGHPCARCVTEALHGGLGAVL